MSQMAVGHAAHINGMTLIVCRVPAAKEAVSKGCVRE